jgi:hypothetical protein
MFAFLVSFFAQELSIAIFPQPLRSMAGNMVVGNSVGSCRLSGCYFQQFS